MAAMVVYCMVALYGCGINFAARRKILYRLLVRVVLPPPEPTANGSVDARSSLLDGRVGAASDYEAFPAQVCILHS